MPHLRLTAAAAIIAGALTAVGAASVAAQTIEEFYRGKTINLIISSGVGGGDDLVARTLTRVMPNHLPGQPNMIIRHMPGAGHVLATNHMYNQAPRDGTHIATVGNSIPLHQALDGKGVRFDATKFGWLGSTGSSNLMTVVRKGAGVANIQDVMTREITAGSTGAGSNTMLYPSAMNNVLGTKFRIVTGYRSGGEIDLAIERGEVDARGGFSLSSLAKEHPDWVQGEKVIFLVQIGGQREKRMPDVPLMHELAKTTEQRQILELLSSTVTIGRPYLTPPEVPEDRFLALRKAFDAAIRDREFISESQRHGFDLIPMDGDTVAKLVAQTINTPPDVVAKAKGVLEAAQPPAKEKPEPAGEKSAP